MTTCSTSPPAQFQGNANVTLTFDNGTDPDTAVVQNAAPAG
ncbi:MAG: hypothetical protein WDM77_19835 [Steroidobacteraceae bacterium]